VREPARRKPRGQKEKGGAKKEERSGEMTTTSVTLPFCWEAWYGVGNSVVNITTQINAAVLTHWLTYSSLHPTFVVGSFSFSITDPAPGATKMLMMIYTSGGILYNICKFDAQSIIF